MTLHERITELSIEHGSLRAAAAAIGVEVSYLSRLASGEKTNPSADTLRALGLEASTTYFRCVSRAQAQQRAMDMSNLRKWFHCLRAGHQDVFVRNIYGDEIIARNYARSIWKCSHCGRYGHRAALAAKDSP